MRPQSTLVAALLAEQERLGLSNPEMARRLRLSLREWGYVKSGERVPSARLLSAISQQFPTLQLRVLEHLTVNPTTEQQAS